MSQNSINLTLKLILSNFHICWATTACCAGRWWYKVLLTITNVEICPEIICPQICRIWFVMTSFLVTILGEIITKLSFICITVGNELILTNTKIGEYLLSFLTKYKIRVLRYKVARLARLFQTWSKERPNSYRMNHFWHSDAGGEVVVFSIWGLAKKIWNNSFNFFLKLGTEFYIIDPTLFELFIFSPLDFSYNSKNK